MNINVTLTDDQLFDLLQNLDEDQREKMVKSFSYDFIIEVWKMLKKTDYEWYGFTTGWWRSWSEIREALVKIQWIEKEYREDKESVIKSLKSSVEHYKKYYDKIFELYHANIIEHSQLPK